jgi:hypothetical protein
MTDCIVIDPDPGLVDRLAGALRPWLSGPSQAVIERQREPEPEARR